MACGCCTEGGGQPPSASRCLTVRVCPAAFLLLQICRGARRGHLHLELCHTDICPRPSAVPLLVISATLVQCLLYSQRLPARVHCCTAGLGNEEVRAATAEALQLPAAAAAGSAAVAAWRRRPDGEGLEVVHHHPVTHVAWHSRGDYFASVAPTGGHWVLLKVASATVLACPACCTSVLCVLPPSMPVPLLCFCSTASTPPQRTAD